MSSNLSIYTSTVSPALILMSSSLFPNSLNGTLPSDLSPTSIKIISFSIDKTVPDTTEPSILAISWKLWSSSSAKFSPVELAVISAWDNIFSCLLCA